MDLAKIPADAETWEKVIVKAAHRRDAAPGMPRPDAAASQAFVSSIETRLDSAAQAKPYAGRPLLHRMNRAEYANAIRDLLALEVDAAALLPPDDSAYGFDNISDALGLSPSLQERYLSAAASISALAIGDPNVKAGRRHLPDSPGPFAEPAHRGSAAREPSAGSWCITIFRWMANTSSRPSCIGPT